MDGAALWLSLRLASCTTLALCVLGLPLAWWLAASRRSKSRGKLFFRLAQQAVTVDPVTHYRIVHPELSKLKSKPQPVGVR